jgi:hypothetical protein
VKIKILLITGFVLLALLSGCHTSRKMAKEFVLSEEMPAILFISSPAVYSEFFRPDQLRDSLNYFKPEKILYFIDDIFINVFSATYDKIISAGMRERGFAVFETDSVAGFFSDSGDKWQLTLQQVTFEEHRLIYEDEITFDEYSIVWDTVVSEYQFNVWFELLPVNADTTVPTHVFFASASIVDNLKGRFVYDWGKGVYDYVYSFSEVEADDLYNLIAASALTHSDYLFDFFLNRYLHFSTPAHKNKGVYYTWDRMKQKLLPAGTDRFVFL